MLCVYSIFLNFIAANVYSHMRVLILLVLAFAPCFYAQTFLLTNVSYHSLGDISVATTTLLNACIHGYKHNCSADAKEYYTFSCGNDLDDSLVSTDICGDDCLCGAYIPRKYFFFSSGDECDTSFNKGLLFKKDHCIPFGVNFASYELIEESKKVHMTRFRDNTCSEVLEKNEYSLGQCYDDIHIGGRWTLIMSEDVPSAVTKVFASIILIVAMIFVVY